MERLPFKTSQLEKKSPSYLIDNNGVPFGENRYTADSSINSFKKLNKTFRKISHNEPGLLSKALLNINGVSEQDQPSPIQITLDDLNQIGPMYSFFFLKHEDDIESRVDLITSDLSSIEVRAYTLPALAKFPLTVE